MSFLLVIQTLQRIAPFHHLFKTEESPWSLNEGQKVITRESTFICYILCIINSFKVLCELVYWDCEENCVFDLNFYYFLWLLFLLKEGCKSLFGLSMCKVVISMWLSYLCWSVGCKIRGGLSLKGSLCTFLFDQCLLKTLALCWRGRRILVDKDMNLFKSCVSISITYLLEHFITPFFISFNKIFY